MAGKIRIRPDYVKIYTEILHKNHPEKFEECRCLLKKKMSNLDIIRLNQKIFGISDQESEIFSRKHRAYDKTAILQILDYQKIYKLNNKQLAAHFKLSRNTIAKWKESFYN
ncbi:hypothetical protein HNP38_001631 [Chryseobacterium defluvii]|uniref:Helix-turn-helix protein n=1 Tax=Chryseobacterium defluvii TaxID=160396 RepID=A0A840KAF3_9FLAO|nr:helix-turn-helix domain-containing protein [Chryseobacterium defluvii]MBB4806359.1 hypothetical protein [Chryseobacterium defluvii]